MARRPPRGRGGRPAGRRPAPPMDEDLDDFGSDDLLGDIDLSSDVNVPLTRQELTSRRDRFVVGVMTPAILLVTFVAVLVASQSFYPDPDAWTTPTPSQAQLAEAARATPTVQITLEPINPVTLNAGVTDKPPPFEWPEIDDLKLTIEPGRPNEQADYTPQLAATELRKLIAVMTVNLTQHTGAPFATGAAAELAKSYPLRRTQQAVVDQTGTIGYIPDDTGVGLVYTVGNYRIQIEAIAASPPIRPPQRAEFEYHTLHLGDHIARRVQEGASVRRTGAEAAAVHWRDHLTRSLPFGR